jgi:hypothetical protein
LIAVSSIFESSMAFTLALTSSLHNLCIA